MSSLRRFLSASAASWVRILLTASAQVLLVPVFLGHWSVEQYGCWLIIQTVGSIASILSLSYQNFVGFEFLKIGDKQPDGARRLFYSALPIVVLIALLELSVLACLIGFGYFDSVFDSNRSLNQHLLHAAFWSLIIYSVSWLIGSSVAGLAWRALVPYGYFPRVAWWNAVLAAVSALTSGVAVVLGADLLRTVVWISAAGLVANIPFHFDMWRMFRRHGLHPVRPDWKFGLRNALRSLAIALTAVLDISRLQGVRIFLGALVGVAEMTAFATMRTVSNLSLQGIGTITNPVTPEIMRFLRARDSARTQAAVGLVWLLAVALLAPVLVVFQWIMPVIFHGWTRGKIAFNPAMFGIFSITLLLFSLARPSATVLQGNNLLRVQLFVAITMCATAVPSILVLTPAFGVIGAAGGMLLAELFGTVLTISSASRWLKKNGIGFPSRLFAAALSSIAVATTAIVLVIWLPRDAAAVVASSLIASGFICVALVRQLPLPTRAGSRFPCF